MARKNNTPVMFSSVVAEHLDTLRREFKHARSTTVDIFCMCDEGDEGFDVTYHATRVVRVRYEGDRVVSVVLNTNGHLTATTKARMNDVLRIVGLPVQVYQKDYAWHLRHGNVEVGFQDNVDAARVFGTLV